MANYGVSPYLVNPQIEVFYRGKRNLELGKIAARTASGHCGAFRARVRIFQGFVCSSTTVLYNIAIIIYF